MVTDKVLSTEAYKSKESKATPLFIELPLLPEHLPLVVSTPRPGKFIVVDKLSKDGYGRTGVFERSTNSLDVYLSLAFQKCLEVSKGRGFNNVFKVVSEAREYIRDVGMFESQDKSIVVGPQFITEEVSRTMDVNYHSLDLPFTVVLSHPEFVGMYFSFLTTSSSAMIFHNLEKGMAFVINEH